MGFGRCIVQDRRCRGKLSFICVGPEMGYGRRMSFESRPARVASGAISTRSPSVKMWTNAREVGKILLGSVCAHVLGVLCCEALMGVGVISAPLVRGSVIASLDALPRCAAAFPFPRIVLWRRGGFTLLIRWEKGQVADHGASAVLSGFVVAVFASGKVSTHCNMVPRGW